MCVVCSVEMCAHTVCTAGSMCLCVYVCVTHAADTLQNLGHSLHRLGNDLSGNTHLASNLKKGRAEEEKRVRRR